VLQSYEIIWISVGESDYFRIFAPFMCQTWRFNGMAETKIVIASDYSLGKILSNLVYAIFQEQSSVEGSRFLQALLTLYNSFTNSEAMPADVLRFSLDDQSTSEAINTLKNHLQSLVPNGITGLNSPITYLLDELICNIQQHAQTDAGYAFANYNPASDSIEIIIADGGVSIYGSYAAAQKHLEILGDSDAQALNLAQSGYSVKNLPETENRGYGISSNMRMVVEGLKGEFAVLSGNALLVQFAKRKEILSLPKEIDFKGTMVIVRFPAHVPTGFDFYTYIS
jgi:hypothetical protein